MRVRLHEAGYSIFHETLADMAWPGNEKAAKYNVDRARAFVPAWCRMMAEAIAAYLTNKE
jgi:hypothetical protein